uniref:DUF3592 domain-containing protein n=1 Tax=Virus NIOZ-UU159 TaxID=2763270 RepID=A0A7S9SVN3_9VIRU|nr:MAG: hypothetical protein NIOZUU159_00363 [Virus NIOZ-UU159]
MKIKGGNTKLQQVQVGKQGFIGTELTDIKINQNVLNPIYNKTASIGIIYNVVITIVFTILFGFLIYVGFWIKDVDINKSENVLGKYKNVKCTQEIIKDKDNNNKSVNVCNAVIVYMVEKKEYIKSYKASKLVNENQPVKVYYNPANPDDFIIEKNTYYFGLGMIIVGFVIIVLSWLWLMLSIAFKPIASASGVNTIGDALK